MKSMENEKMTKSERSELGQLIRKRERVMKSLAVERSAQMLADFDTQLAEIYSFDDDEVWKEAKTEAEKVVDDANVAIAERCETLGIPKEFAPSLGFAWYGRGENAVAARRSELRRAAKSQIAALEKEAISKIERMSLTAQTEVITNGLESKAATEFLQRLPSLESLMPMISATEIKQIQEKSSAANYRLTVNR